MEKTYERQYMDAISLVGFDRRFFEGVMFGRKAECRLPEPGDIAIHLYSNKVYYLESKADVEDMYKDIIELIDSKYGLDKVKNKEMAFIIVPYGEPHEG